MTMHRQPGKSTAALIRAASLQNSPWGRFCTPCRSASAASYLADQIGSACRHVQLLYLMCNLVCSPLVSKKIWVGNLVQVALLCAVGCTYLLLGVHLCNAGWGDKRYGRVCELPCQQLD